MTKHGEPLTFYLDHVEDDTDDCIVWPYGSNSEGYGHLLIEGRQQYVHILACQRRYGPMPRPGMFAIHAPLVCHNRRCFNWRHLRWATHDENMRDLILDGMSHGDRGEANRFAKLTQEQVIEIRARYAAGGVLQRELAVEFGVSQGAINNIVRRLGWAHI